MDPAVSERPLVPGRGRPRSGAQPVGGAASLGIPEARGPGNWERWPHSCRSSGPCAGSVTPGAVCNGPESQGRPSAGPGRGELQERAGQKGPPHLTHQGSSLAVTCSSGRESRGQGETLGTHLHRRGQDPGSPPAASRPCAKDCAFLWPVPLCGPTLLDIWTSELQRKTKSENKRES